jgi:uncharacterized protein YggE
MKSISNGRLYRVTLGTWVLSIALWSLGMRPAFAQNSPDRLQRELPTLTVTGRGEAVAAPDRATLRLGAIAENSEAAKAQAQVNEIVQRTLKAWRELKVPENKIKTAGMGLTPVYEQQERAPRVTRPRIIGYRAHNTLQIQIDDLQRIGQVVDAAVAAGANQIEDLRFDLQNDMEPRRDALRFAADEARVKAETLAAAMGIRITGVREVIEGGVHVLQPRVDLAMNRMAFGAEQSTPVQPGEINVEATVTIRYDIADRPR